MRPGQAKKNRPGPCPGPVFCERERERTWTHVHVRYMLSPVRLSVVCRL